MHGHWWADFFYSGGRRGPTHTYIYIPYRYGHWWADFFYSGWNWFDLIIVSVSLVDAVFVMSGGGGTGLNVMRLIRIFRIVRIFNKLDDLKRILNAIISSMGQVWGFGFCVHTSVACRHLCSWL